MHGANMKIIVRPSVLITNILRVIGSTADNIKTDLKKNKMTEWYGQHSCGSEQKPEEGCCRHADELPVSIKAGSC